MDLYVPRKCSATNRVLHAKDHAAVQINIGQVCQLKMVLVNIVRLMRRVFIQANQALSLSLDS